ncbi:hypothetical protein Hypma_005977 [Hypsizygus marmoreus]|uniref:LysM domain-containing protein n=1 Tax=Hypsizygus marmoreus TaxID=39966 RepID=A0A369K8C7_HYPMA|nr:hypothetical protein Hypma_005977 [Hypsizygus marmoreus]
MFFTAALFALPLFAQSVLAGECTRRYIIKDGDICDSISAAQNVSTYQLSAINVGVIDAECLNLVPSKTICLGYAGEDCSTTYTVVADDTCEQIASNHKLNSTILTLNNPQINAECTNIYIGEVLCVANTVQVPPAPAGGNLPGAVIPVTAKPAKPTSTPVQIQITTVESTTVVNVTPAPTPEVTKAPAAGEEDDDTEDDDDLPFCDEI